MREKVRQGADPTNDKRARSQLLRDARAVQQPTISRTIRTLFDEYEEQKARSKKSWPRSRTRLTSMLAVIIDKPFSNLTFADLRNVFEKHPSKISAKWGCQMLKPVFRWAIDTKRDYVPPEFVSINFGEKPSQRTRVLSRQELALVLGATKQQPDDVYFTAMRFILLTLLRLQEACGLRWKHIDFQSRTLTLPETKNGQSHQLPLSDQALEILSNQRAKIGHNSKAAGQEQVVFKGIMSNWNPAQLRVNKLSGTSGWHRHDLLTGATLLGEMGYEPHVVEAALNHVSIHSQIAATYNRSRYQPKVAEALQRLADHLDGLSCQTLDHRYEPSLGTAMLLAPTAPPPAPGAHAKERKGRSAPLANPPLPICPARVVGARSR